MQQTVKNSTVVAERIQEIQITPEDRLVSFDVTRLFTQVPTDEALRFVDKQLTKDQSSVERTSIPVCSCLLVELVELCLQTAQFPVPGGLFCTDRWCCNGFPLSPIIANLFMENLAQRAIQSAHSKVNLCMGTICR